MLSVEKKMLKREILSVVLFCSVTMLSFSQMQKTYATDTPESAEKFIAGIMGGSMIGLKNPANELSRFNSIPVHYLGFSMPAIMNSGSESGNTAKTEYILSMVGTYKLTDFFGLQSGLHYMINQGSSYVGANGGAQSASGSLVNIWYTSVDIPVLAHFEYKQQDGVLLGGFIGPYASIPIGNAHISGAMPSKNSDRDRFDPFDNGSSLNPGESDSSPKMGGISYGISLGMFVGYKAGPGYLVVNASYMKDSQAVKVENDIGEVFTRSAINLNIGYEFRF
jgi:hypothetical protein